MGSLGTDWLCMDRTGYVHQRKKRYMAQLLEGFEEGVEARIRAVWDQLPAEVRDELEASIQEFKGQTRRKLNALAVDAVEIFSLEDAELNGYGMELRDKTHPEGRPLGAIHT